MTHDAKSCMERPRKVGAKWTHKHIAPDEKIESFELDYDGKRDRWNGYDTSNYARVVERYEARDAARSKFLKEQQLKKLEEKNGKQNDEAVASDEENYEDELRVDEAKVDESKQMDFAKVEKRVRTTGGGSTGTVRLGQSTIFVIRVCMISQDMQLFRICIWLLLLHIFSVPLWIFAKIAKPCCRNLRIREDTAKYLLNLDVNSAHYDPKTRSMREDPLPDADPNEKFYGVSTVKSIQYHWCFNFILYLMVNSTLFIMFFREITNTEIVVKRWSSSS